jgi:hypothetical protein
MMMNESPPKRGYTSSERTDDSARSNPILALGRNLVEELGLEPSGDTLGRWMAHYVAGLIERAEGTTGEEKSLAEKNCFEAILALWRHRAELPNGKRPFEKLEPVIRAIESLDPDDDTPRYFRSARPAKADREKSEADTWLEMVSGLDDSAKILIRHCLAEAARATEDKSEEWVKLAEAAGADDGVPEIVIRVVSTAADLAKGPDLDAAARHQLQDRIRRLEGFIKLAGGFAHDLKTRLEALPPAKEGGDDDPDDHMVLSSAPPFG